MNKLVQMTNEMTMDSLEFLRNVINPARLEFGEPEVQNSKFIARVEDELDDLPAVKIIHRFGNEVKSYDLTVDQMMLVGMRESKSVRRKVRDRLSEMQTPAIPKTYAAALLEAGRLALEVERQAEQLALASPKVEFVDRYVDSSGDLGFRQVAKLLKENENELRGWLISEKIMYRLGKNLTPMANHIEAGRFNTYVGSVQHGDSGHSWAQAKFTAKGVEWIAAKWAQYKIKAALTGGEE